MNPLMNSTPSTLSSCGWHVLYTRHQHEKTVNRILEGQGIETLLPLRLAANKWRDRTKLIQMPLFPCYVFFRAGIDSCLQVLKTPGVHMIVPGCSGPAIVPPEEIEAVRRLTESCEFVEPFPYLKNGDRVRVKSGALEGVEGFLVRKKNFYRLVVSVEILGKSAATEIDAFSVERVTSFTRRDAVQECIKETVNESNANPSAIAVPQLMTRAAAANR